MSEKAVRKVLEHAREGLNVREAFFEENAQHLVDIAKTMALALTEGGKVLFCGNGGSAATASTWPPKFVNRFRLERPPLPALALTTDTSILTAIGNDYGFDLVFVKQVQALGLAGDILIGISTSGTSRNVIAALREAKARGW
jgi:D-sedoheptulose 7-phosphate isomerase